MVWCIAQLIKNKLQSRVDVFRFHLRSFTDFHWTIEMQLEDLIMNGSNRVPTEVIFWIGQNDADSFSRKSTRHAEELKISFKHYLQRHIQKIKSCFASYEHVTLRWVLPMDDDKGAFLELYKQMVAILHDVYVEESTCLKIKGNEDFVYEWDQYHFVYETRLVIADKLIDWYFHRRSVKANMRFTE